MTKGKKCDIIREREWRLTCSERPVSLCQITNEKSPEEARAYTYEADRQPLDVDRALYCAEILPLTTGGSVIYVRFHHVIVDGYGMSLFAQGVLDSLENRPLRADPFFAETQGKETESELSFWQEYFDEAEFESAIFSEKATKTDFFSHESSVEPSLSDALSAFAEAHKLTPAYVLAAAYALYLAEAYSYLEIGDLLSNENEEIVLPKVEQEDLAYMIYTSGTMGKPKGVMLSHKGIANITHPDNNPFNRDITKNCHGIVAIGSICFDISLFEIFVPLFNGRFVEFGNEKAMVDAGELAEHITRHGVDILHCTPSRIAAKIPFRP